MRWIEALKVWNRTKRECNPAHVWCTPRRDTPEHKEVKAIMERAKPEAVAKVNEERRADTLSRLRAEETKTMIRNYERRKEAEKLLAEAEARRAKPAEKVKKPRKTSAEEEKVRKLIGRYMAINDIPSVKDKIKILKSIANNATVAEDTSGDYDYYDQDFELLLPKLPMLLKSKEYRNGMITAVDELFRGLGIEKSYFRKEDSPYDKKTYYYIILNRSDRAGDEKDRRGAYRELIKQFEERIKILKKLSKGGFKNELEALEKLEKEMESESDSE